MKYTTIAEKTLYNTKEEAFDAASQDAKSALLRAIYQINYDEDGNPWPSVNYDADFDAAIKAYQETKDVVFVVKCIRA